MSNNNPIIHNGVVLHGVQLAPQSQITYLVTNQAIIPKMLQKDDKEIQKTSNLENTK